MAFYLPNNEWRQVATSVGEVTIKAVGAVRVYFGSFPTGSDGTIYAYKTWCVPSVVDGGGAEMWVKSADVGPATTNGFRSAVWVTGSATLEPSDVLPKPVFPVSSLGVSLASSSALAPWERLVTDRNWSWHINDIVLHDTVTSRTYVTGQVQADGSQVIDIYSPAGSLVSTEVVNDNVLTNFVPDDHNAPALVMFNGTLFCGYAGHNDDQNIYVKRSTDTTPENLGSEFTIPNNGNTTYVQFAVVNGELYVAGRSGTQSWRMHKFNPSDGSWGDTSVISTSSSQTYINLRSSGSELRYIAWDHPTNSAEPQRGEIKVREFQPGDASVSLGSLTTVYDPGAGKSTRTLDILPDGSALLFAEFTIGSSAGQEYFVLRFTGSDYNNPSDWSLEAVGTNDYTFYASSNYIPGACFADAQGNSVWVSEGSGSGITTIQYGQKSGSTWNFTEIGQSTVPLVRPATDVYTSGQVWFHRLNSYASFTNLDADAVVLFTGDRNITNSDFSPPLPPVAGLRGSPQIFQYFGTPDLSDVSWTVDLSGAQDGDLLVAVYVYRNNGPSDLDLGGSPFTEDFNTSDSNFRMYTSTLVYNSTMGDTLTLDAQGTPSFQKLMLCVVTPGYSVQAAGVNPSYQAGDVVVGMGSSAGDTNALHTYTPDVRVSRAPHGNNTVISFGAGEASSSGTASIADMGPSEPLNAFVVIRPD